MAPLSFGWHQSVRRSRRRIRQLGPPAGAVPIVGFTTNVREEDRRCYQAAGMNHCLSKTVAWPELAAALDDCSTTRTPIARVR